MAQQEHDLLLEAQDLASNSLFQALGDNAYELDPDFRFLVFNEGCASYYGIEPETALGRTIWDALPGARGSWLEDYLRAAMAARRPVRVEQSGVVRPDCWVEVTAFPTARGLGVTFRDRTAERRATEALRQSEARKTFLLRMEERLRALTGPYEVMTTAAELLGRHIKAARTGYAEVDPTGRILRVTQDWTDGRVPRRAGETRPLDAFGHAAASELRSARVLVVEDCLTDSRTLGDDVAATWASIGIRSLVVAPLVKTGALQAFFYAHDTDARKWTPSEIEMTGEVAERTWAAVERARAEAQLRESEARLALATEAAGLGIWDWDLEANRFVYSPRAKAIFGFAMDREPTYEEVCRATHPDDFPRTSAAARRALDPALRERPVFDYRAVRPDGRVRRVVAHGWPVFERVGDADRAVRYVGTLQDVTEQWEAREALRESEARLRLAVEAGRMAVWEYDVATDTVSPSPELNRLLGFAEDATPTIGEMRARYWPGHHERVQAISREALARGDRFIEAEYRYLWPDGTVRWLLMRAEVRLASDGSPLKAVGVVIDITERKAAEDRQALLMREVDHRAKNALAVVQAALRLTRAPDLPSYIRTLEGRVGTLARSQTLLANDRWSGADLRKLLEGELMPFVPDGHSLEMTGPAVLLPAWAAQPIAMAVHELATNAVKHGALSAPDGRVFLRWAIGGTNKNGLVLRWLESGGPPIKTPPAGRGFGSRVLEGTIQTQLGGTVCRTWEPAGLVCTIEVPLVRGAGSEASPAAMD